MYKSIQHYYKQLEVFTPLGAVPLAGRFAGLSSSVDALVPDFIRLREQTSDGFLKLRNINYKHHLYAEVSTLTLVYVSVPNRVPGRPPRSLSP